MEIDQLNADLDGTTEKDRKAEDKKKKQAEKIINKYNITSQRIMQINKANRDPIYTQVHTQLDTRMEISQENGIHLNKHKIQQEGYLQSREEVANQWDSFA